MAGRSTVAGNVFISYRRTDSLRCARAVNRAARKWMSENDGAPTQVFFDLDSMYPANDYRDVLRHHIQLSDIVLVVIGPDWLDARDDEGKRRLAQRNDPVRLEVECALTSDRPLVVPLLVDDVAVPRPRQLPEKIRGLAYPTSYRVSSRRTVLPRELLEHFRGTLATWSATLHGKEKRRCSIAVSLTHESHIVSFQDKIFLPGRGESDLPANISVDGHTVAERKYHLGPVWEFTIADGAHVYPAVFTVYWEFYGLLGLGARVGSISLDVAGRRLYAD